MRLPVLCVNALLLVGLAACGQSARQGNPSMEDAVATSEAAIRATQAAAVPAMQASAYAGAVTVSAVVAPSFETSVAQADLIVIGQISAIGDVINTRRDTQDTTKPASDSFGVGQVYQLQVERYLKGHGPALLPLLQDEGAIEIPPTAVTQADIAHARALYGVPPLVKGTRYLVLISPHTELDRTITYYNGNSYPWIYTLHPDGSATAYVPRDAAFTMPSSFAPSDATLLIARIKDLVADKASPTPAQ